MKKLTMILGLVAGMAFATEYSVTDTRKVVLTETGDALTTAAVTIPETLPEVGTPLFRFDAKNTSGWSFDASDATKITGIPSSVGSRKLTMSNAGGNWTSFTLVSPVLTNDPTLGNQPCVDFGAIGSKKGLIFDAVDGTNELANIGSIFLVFNSEKGGGALMGGGSGQNGSSFNTYNMWLRGLTPKYPSAQWNNNDPYSFLIRYYASSSGIDIGFSDAAMGRVYHDGFVASPWKIGLNGGWEVVSLQPKAATLRATGVGLGFARAGFGSSSGGQRIAELIVYGEVLSDDDRAKVEAYLEKKWFARDLRGWGSNAAVDVVRASMTNAVTYTKNGAQVGVTVEEGKYLNVGKLIGGRGGYATFTKNGEGSLAIGDASAYQGTMHANGGTLVFAKRAIPAALPADDCAHFDASDESTLTCETDDAGLKRVTKWASKSDFLLNGKTLCLAPNATESGKYSARVPWICEGMLNGKAALDFGKDITSGNHLVLSDSDAVSTTLQLDGVTTVIAVVSPYANAPYLVGAWDNQEVGNAAALSYFNAPTYNRGWASSLFSSTVLTAINPVLSGRNANVMWVDGVRNDHTKGYPQPGWQVIAITGPGSKIGAVGGGAHYYYAGGAMCLAEIVMYARPVSEQEILDASAYLRNKWMGLETPGYARTASRAAVPDVQKLSVDAASTIDVAEGTTVRIGTLSGSGVLTKTGAGTLEVENEGSAKIILKNGLVKTVAAAEPASLKTMAKDPSAHFDASDAATLVTQSVDDRQQILMWYDKTGRNCAYHPTSGNQPWVNETDTLNGHSVIDFGSTDSWRYLRFGLPLDGIKAAFVVWGSQNGGGTLLGSYRDQPGWGNGDVDDFRRIVGATATNLIFNENNTSQHVWGGKIFTNGVEVSYNKAVPSGNWDLVEVYPLGAAHASAFAFGRAGNLTGGQRLAEVILYERELSEREKVATRNYLMQKWFGKTDAELTPLPDAPAVESVKIEKLDVAAGETVTLDEDVDYEIGEITGSGTIVKSGTGDISVGPASGFTGTLQVNSGKLALTAMPQPKLATDGLEMWLDATNVPADSITQEGSANVVSNWVSQVPGSTLVARGHRYSDSYMTIPQYIANGGPNDSPYFYFRRGAYFRFKDNADDTYKRFTDVQTVFWVIGSQNGGGMLLGDSTAAGGATGTPTFRRVATTDAGNPNSFPGYYASDPLLTSTAQQEVREADWKENGAAVDPMTDGLSGSWDIVSCNLQADAAKATSADGLAYVGGQMASQWCCGFQNLAEVLIYNRRLTSGEVCEVESYLGEKYGLNVGKIEPSFTNGLKVTLAEGASLESIGRSRYVDGLAGLGSVAGDITIGGLVANASKPVIEVAGTMTIPAGIKVTVESLGDESWTPIVAATAYAGAENLSSAVITGTTRSDLKLRIRNGVLGIRKNQGLSVILR